MAAIFLAPFYILVNIYLFRWIFLWLWAVCPSLQSPVFFVFSALICILVSTSPLTGFLIKKPVWLHRILKITGNFFLGILLYIFLVIFTADIIRIIIKYGFRLSWINSRFSFILTGGICALLILLICAYGIHHVAKVKIKRYSLKIRKYVPDMKSLKIVLVGDFHFGFSTDLKHIGKIIQAINREKPDLVCIAGDTFDNEFDAVLYPEKLQTLLRTIKSRYGVYACWGNHDLNEPILAGFTFRNSSVNPEDPRMEEFLKNSSVHLLNDQAELIDQKFYLIGREDPGRADKLGIKRKTPAQLTKKLDRGKPVIILDHQPKDLEELSSAGVDLDLCGHTHNGQIFPGNVFTHFFWENSCGYLQKGTMHNIVTSGAGVWGPAMRIGTSSEICVIRISFPVTRTLEPEKDLL